MGGLAAAVPVIGKVLGGLGAAASGVAAVSSAMQKPELPKIEPPLPMPDPEAQEAARRRKVAATMQRAGRQSTLLSGTSSRETLG